MTDDSDETLPSARKVPISPPAHMPIGLEYASAGQGTQAAGFAPPARPLPSGFVKVVAGLAVLLFLASALIPGGSRPREPANRLKCASNLRQIGMACVMYAGSGTTGGRFPDSVATLFAASDLTADVFNCPSSNATRAVGPTTQATAALLQNSPPSSQPTHCQSYVYVGGGLTIASPPTAVVAYDLPENHANKGGNVVFADCSVAWYDSAPFAAVVAAVQAGQNPPPLSATRPGVKR